MPMSRRSAGMPETSLPSTVTAPVSAVSKPARMRSAVVLPQPDGPSSATSSPGRDVQRRPSSALGRAEGAGQVLQRRRWRHRRLRRPPAAAGRSRVFVGHEVLPSLGWDAANRLTSPRAGAAAPAGCQHRDDQQEQPGHEQGQQRGGDRDRRAGLVEVDDPDRERLVQVEAGHRVLAQDQGDGQHGGREHRGAAGWAARPATAWSPSRPRASWTPRPGSSGRSRASPASSDR